MRLVLRCVPIALCALSLVLLFGGRRAQTLPLYAAREKMQCQMCHVDPNGGGIRNEFGFNYGKNRHSLTPETGKPWGDLNLSNRVADNVPIYFGLNMREMLLMTTSLRPHSTPSRADSLERAAFFPMENAFHVSFQPHSMLAAQLTWDFNDFSSATLREGYGMLRGGPWGGYLKFGRFRPPFGLRMDDHTVATRNSFLDFSYNGLPGPRFLPYDPRSVDAGLEVGGSQGPLFGRAAWTNGSSNAFFGSTYAQAKTAKIGVQKGLFQVAASIYDDFNSSNTFPPYRRATRWGGYGMVNSGRVTGIVDVDAGTDDQPGDVKTNLLAGFAEADWQPSNPYNVRLRFDYLDTDRSTEDAVHTRYALEGEWMPVPFAELRTVFRYIDHRDPTLYDEKQFYLQAHFTY